MPLVDRPSRISRLLGAAGLGVVVMALAAGTPAVATGSSLQAAHGMGLMDSATASQGTAPTASTTGTLLSGDLSSWGAGQDRPVGGSQAYLDGATSERVASATAPSDPTTFGTTETTAAATTTSDAAAKDTTTSDAAATDTTTSDATATDTSATTAAPASWVVRGAGWGHSIGMSQYGAREMARDGMTASQILRTYYTGTTYDLAPDTAVLRVNVLSRVSSVTAKSTSLATGGGSFSLTVPSAGSPTMTGSVGDTVTLTRSSTSGVVASCSTCDGATRLTGSFATLRWDATGDRTAMDLNGKRYRDGYTVVHLTSTGSALHVVNHVRLHDEYLDYLREMPWSWEAEALKAQAAAARGYALRKYAAGVRSECACHVYDTSVNQVYGTYTQAAAEGSYWTRWRSAVRAAGSGTSGYVVRYGGSIIEALYSASHGGRSENNEDVWGGTALPYLRGVADPWSLRPSNPRASWRLTPSGSTLATAFRLPDVVRLDLRDRTVNGGVHTARATSSSGATATITGEQLRLRVGIHSVAVRHLTSRLAGADRYATGAAVARTVAPSATSVVLAAADSSLVDAAVSGPLAGTLGAPLLLTARTSLPPPTVAELTRRGSTVRTAYVVGGTGVVSESVVSALRDRGLSVVRVAGSDRYRTAEAVAAQIAARRTVTGIVVAGGDGLADALGASGAATATKEPILLTPASGLADATRRALTTTGATHARVVGGQSVVGAAVVTELGSRGLAVVRLAGADRYASSAAVADFYRSRVPTTSSLVLTSGDDATLVDSLVAGSMGRLLVLSSPGGLPEPAARTLQSTANLDTVVAVGGTGVLPGAVLTAAARS